MLPAIDRHLKYGSPVLWLKRRATDNLPELSSTTNTSPKKTMTPTPSIIRNVKEMPMKLKVYNKKLSQKSIKREMSRNERDLTPDQRSSFRRKTDMKRFSNINGADLKQSIGSDKTDHIDEIIVIRVFNLEHLS
jgi:hypothetical protein